MTPMRPFETSDLPATIIGLAFGLFFGFMGILVLWFVLFDFGWMILLIGLPLLVIQLVAIFAFDRFVKWRRRDDPPPPPSSWLRFHSVKLGGALGTTGALIFLAAGLMFGDVS